MANESPVTTAMRFIRRQDPRLVAMRRIVRRRGLAAVLELCDRMDADPMNGGVVLTSAVRAAAGVPSVPR